MRPRRVLEATEAAELFAYAVNERALAVLTLQRGRDWMIFKSRFLEADPSQRFFVLDYEPLNDCPPPDIAPGQYIGVSFRNRSRKILFASIVEARGRFAVDAARSVPAVRYRWPDTLTELQRRAYYRTVIPSTLGVLASVWPGGTTARAAAQSRDALLVSTGQLADLSCGGALVRLNANAPPDWVENTTLGVELGLSDGKPPLMLNAQYRGARNDEQGHLCAAVQFVGMELSVDGQLSLQRIAKYVQRLHRLGYAGGNGAGRGAPPF